MNISYDLVNHILATLPIGYYLGRNINVELSHCDRSYYSPLEDKIVLGYKMIAEAFSKVVDGKYNVDVEEVIRGLLYHEISHVVLTPDKLWDAAGHSSHNHHVVNVFEDERIETLLAKRYMNTNFRKNLIFLNNYDGTDEPKNADDAFYNVVRYHKGKKQFVNRVAQIIRRYANINRSYADPNYHIDEYYYSNGSEYSEIQSYVKAIFCLYNDIAKDFEENKNNEDQNQDQDQNQEQQNGNDQSQQNQSSDENNDQENDNDQSSENNQSENEDENEDENEESEGNGSSNNDEDENDEDENDEESNGSSSSDSDKDNNEDSDDQDNSDKQNSKPNHGTGDEDEDDSNSSTGEDEEENSLTDDDVNDLIKELDTKFSDDDMAKIFKDALKSVFEVLNDEVLIARLKKIIDEKLKEDDKNGAAISAYSGRFDPRSVLRRDDYKWWNQQNVNGDIRRFSKVHFNLFIDNSGSFCHNDAKMNMFISALNRLRSKDFDFDVITINTEIDEWKDTTSKRFRSCGCNCLHAVVGQVVRRHTQSQANNYNIILFDGDADADVYSDGTTAFKYFDGPNTILITDKGNEKYLGKSLRQAKVVVIDNNYCSVFIDTVCNLLERVM